MQPEDPAPLPSVTVNVVGHDPVHSLRQLRVKEHETEHHDGRLLGGWLDVGDVLELHDNAGAVTCVDNVTQLPGEIEPVLCCELAIVKPLGPENVTVVLPLLVPELHIVTLSVPLYPDEVPHVNEDGEIPNCEMYRHAPLDELINMLLVCC